MAVLYESQNIIQSVKDPENGAMVSLGSLTLLTAPDDAVITSGAVWLELGVPEGSLSILTMTANTSCLNMRRIVLFLSLLHLWTLSGQ